MLYNGFMSQCALTAAAVATLVALGDTAAQGAETKCRQAIAKASAKFEAKKIKALQKCKDGVLKGKITPPCPDAKATDKINKAATKLQDAIAKDCELADVALILPGGSCPRFATTDESGSCDVTVATVAELADCVECLSETNVDSMISFLFDGKIASSDGDTLKCQRSTGKNGAKFFAKKRKALQKCADAVIKNGSGTCPDAKATEKINKAAAKLQEKLDKDCAGLGQDDFGGTCFCPAFDIPGAGPACGGPLHSLADLKACVECVMEHKADCLTSVSAPSLGALPTECVPQCGDGAIDAGETCDDGNVLNGDSCPSDCTINPCNSPAGTVTATINISGTTADLSALTVFFTYPDGEARLPGTGDDAAARFTPTNGTASVTPNDLDYGVRVLLTDPFLALGYPPLTVDFDICNGATITDSDFDCWVEFASDNTAAVLSGVTCTVDVP